MHNLDAVAHHSLIGFAGAIPLDKREFRVVERAPLAITERPGEFEYPLLARGEQLLAGELRRRAQVERRAVAGRRNAFGREGVQVQLVSRRDLQDRGLHLGEVLRLEQPAQPRHHAPPRVKEAASVGVNLRVPPGGAFRHAGSVHGAAWAEKTGERRQDRYVARERHCRLLVPSLHAGSPAPIQRGTIPVKVIASSLRKGNIVDLDGKLYVILSAENIHPGKGTPVTQLDMRRLSDGVKSSLRYKTTDQVERAHVEEREYQYLYQDNDGFHFMNMETYDQVSVAEDVIGDQAVYLQPEMKAKLSVHEGVVVGIELPQRVTLEVVETEPTVKGQTASSSYKPAVLSNGVRTTVPPHITAGTRIVVSTADGSYMERAKD